LLDNDKHALHLAFMHNRPNLPDEIWLGTKEYSFWTDWKVNGWLFVATLISAATDVVFPRVVGQWPVPWRAALATVPFLAVLLWVRSLMRWIAEMDELHRRVTVAAVLSAVSAAFFVVLLWHRLVVAGVFPSIAKPGASWDIGTLAHIFLLLTFFYFLSYRISIRRYED
jgi:hypothetical protein